MLPLAPLVNVVLPLVGSLLVLLWLNRLVTVTFVRLFWHLVGDARLAFLLYALLILPGTAVHEISHWLAARLLGVRAALPVLLPQAIDPRGPVTLGHVMIARTDVVRRSLIGAAPFVVGSTLVALIARQAFGLEEPGLSLSGAFDTFGLLANLVSGLWVFIQTGNGAWLYLYLLFAISNGMLPSQSDREAWPLLAATVAVILAVVYLVVGIPRVPQMVTVWSVSAIRWLTFAFLVTVVVNSFCMLGAWPLERLASIVRSVV